MRSSQALTKGVASSTPATEGVRYWVNQMGCAAEKSAMQGASPSKKRLVGEHVRQSPQIALVRGRRVAGTHAGRTTAHGLAILHKGGDPFRRVVAHDLGRTAGLKIEGHDRAEGQAVSPLRHDARQAFVLGGVQSGLRLNVLQHIANQGGVAINVGADLQNRRAPVAARERHHIGLGHHHRDDHAFPSQLFVAQYKTYFLGERRGGIVMKNQVAHGCLSVERLALNQFDQLFTEVFALE